MKQMVSASVAAPGFYGLNTQESAALLSSGFALTASNCLLDKYGRLGARKGWTMRTTGGASSLSGQPIQALFEYISPLAIDIISAGNNKLFRNGVSSSALVDVTPTMTITANNWQMASLLDHCLAVQLNHEPVLMSRETSSFVSNKLVSHSGHGGASFSSPVFGTGAANAPSCVTAAYGRFWAAGSVNNKTTLYWSTDIADASFPSFDTTGSSTAGSLNLSSRIPNNTDEIVALAAHNGLLVVFLKQSIVILQGSDTNFSTPSSLFISDVIAGTGCIARDSIQNTGQDILFLSSSGLRSLGRTVQEKSAPLRDVSKNIRDDLVTTITGADTSLCRSVYSEKNAFYLLSFPTTSTPLVYCFDMRQALPDGAAKVTVWNNYAANALLSTRDGVLYIGKPNGIGEYYGYSDNGSDYLFNYRTNYFDFDTPTTNKVMKKLGSVLIGGGGQRFVLKIGFDYSENYDSYPIELSTGSAAEYTTGEYTTAEYSSGVFVDNAGASIGGAGKVVQIGFEAVILNAPLSVQKLDVFVKQGKSY